MFMSVLRIKRHLMPNMILAAVPGEGWGCMELITFYRWGNRHREARWNVGGETTSADNRGATDNIISFLMWEVGLSLLLCSTLWCTVDSQFILSQDILRVFCLFVCLVWRNVSWVTLQLKKRGIKKRHGRALEETRAPLSKPKCK